MFQQWINAVLGLWIIAVPFLGMTVSALTWTLVITGIVVATLALWSVSETSTERAEGRMVRARHSHS